MTSDAEFLKNQAISSILRQPDLLFQHGQASRLGRILQTPSRAKKTSQMPFQYRHNRRVQFYETDLAGIVHFANFFRYMEEAEHAFYRSLGFSVHKMVGAEGDEPVGWPRVHASADYRKPLKFEDEFQVELRVAAIGSKTIDYQFRFLGKDDELLATGKFTVICVRFDKAEGRMRAVGIPDGIKAKIQVAPADSLEEKSSN